MAREYSREERIRLAIGSALVTVGSVVIAAFTFPFETPLEWFVYGGGTVVFGGITVYLVWSLLQGN